ncbi:peptidoglycan editing factor PgeF [Thermosynechococcaceae cyanobacterium BACA0444]|uniref:Purine nucleoside phosphorylase n=1 Tax=Pseudocalidococcus azoricus BACA0444 TaxID=2918990 RepID=A0AAE4JUV8_9CYAN|nr:peptidoglycan editing factor PgeF [Pseudocalidococcus azoricus]MDS3859695.1 peptidoglycan editing factor PgeF [Pseudocalidococcus azoricus BACA0444]
MSTEQGWAWQSTQFGGYLTCDLLREFPHGFFTRQFAKQSLVDLTAHLQALAQPFRVKQVHGNLIHSTTDIFDNGITTLDYEVQLPGDALVSSKPDQAVWVCSADCVPLLIADVKTGQVAAIHAGWRGTALGITPLTVQQLQAAGSQTQNLRIALGPAISGQNYQVGLDVAVTVGKSLIPFKQGLTLEERLECLQNLENSPISEDATPGRVRLDVRQVNTLQLEHLGITPDQMSVAPYCTFQDSQWFFSYRRESVKQVQWSGIVSRIPKI